MMAGSADLTPTARVAHTAESQRGWLTLLGQLAATSYGPGGRSKMVRANAEGGAVTITSTSHRLFSAHGARLNSS